MSNTNSLTDELTGKTGIQTDHGGIGIGDLLVLGLDAVLLIYTCSGYFAHPTVIFDF